MDFWEGFFLGKYWTDSNFEDKSRKLFFLIISALVCILSTIYFIFSTTEEPDIDYTFLDLFTTWDRPLNSDAFCCSSLSPA